MTGLAPLFTCKQRGHRVVSYWSDRWYIPPGGLLLVRPTVYPSVWSLIGPADGISLRLRRGVSALVRIGRVSVLALARFGFLREVRAAPREKASARRQVANDWCPIRVNSLLPVTIGA
eukprot:1194770-Prorocentrum_minimum.AAC.1